MTPHSALPEGLQMAIFATHVVLMRNFEAVAFAPGDELPEWAAGKVGAHCLVPESEEAHEFESDDVPDGEETDGDNSQDDSGDGETEVEAAEVAEAESPAAVDFTKPARRAPARKK